MSAGRRRWTGLLATAVLTGAVLMAGATESQAAWSVGTAVGAGSPVTVVSARTVPSAGPVTAVRGGLGTTVDVSWSAVTVDGTAVRGYEVVRWRTPVLGTPAVSTGFGGCEGTLTTTSCRDQGSLLGLGGSLYYVVTPLYATNWRGPAATSATV